jgi:hypothetical protein
VAEPFDGEAAKQRVTALLNEMAALRAIEVPPHDADPAEVHRVLREVLRPRLDRAEVIMAEVAGHRRRARAEAKRCAAVTSDAYDKALAPVSGRAMSREYESIKDREVTARVKSSPERQRQRAAEGTADLIEQAEDAVKGMFFGLSGIRRELLADLEHYFPWGASLDR